MTREPPQCVALSLKTKQETDVARTTSKKANVFALEFRGILVTTKQSAGLTSCHLGLTS